VPEKEAAGMPGGGMPDISGMMYGELGRAISLADARD
jgi:hypothetical protein